MTINRKFDVFQNLSSSINKYLKECGSEFNLGYEIVQHKNHNPENYEPYDTKSYVPFLYKDSGKFSPDRLSDTEKAILWTSLLKYVCNTENIDLSETLILFDEPEARADPQYIISLMNILSKQGGKVIIASNSFITLKYFLALDQNQIEIITSTIDETTTNLKLSLTSIGTDKKSLNKQMRRLTGGFTISNDTDSYISSFENIFEDNIVVCEGYTDVKLLNFVKKQLLSVKTLDKKLIEVLNETKFISFFEDSEFNNGGCSKIPEIMMIEKDYLLHNNKNIIGLFDFDKGGIKESSKGFTVDDLSSGIVLYGRILSWKKETNKFHYLIQKPLNYPLNKTEFTIESLLYGKGIPDLDENINNNRVFSGSNKKGVVNHLENLLKVKSNAEILEILSEFIVMFKNISDGL